MTHLVRPHYLIGAAADLTPEAIRDIHPSMSAIIFDFDNTLADFGATELPPENIEMISAMGRAGIVCFVATNIYDEAAFARKRMLRGLRDSRGRKGLIVETVIPETVTPYRDEAHNHKKPKPDMFTYILRTYGQIPERTCVVGDQMRSDMKAAETLGIHRILVDKLGTHDHDIVRLHRPIEAIERHLGHFGFFPEELTSIEEWSARSFSERHAIERNRRKLAL